MSCVDPDGLGEVYFFLYSMIDGPDISGNMEITNTHRDVKALAEDSGLSIKMKYLEDHRKISFRPDDEVKHLTLRVHGNPSNNSVFLWDTENDMEKNLNGEDFVEYLHKKLQTRAERSVKTIKSICFISCGAGRSEIPEPSFVDVFARKANRWFPNLRQVFASPNIALTLETSGTKTDYFTLPSLVSISDHDYQTFVLSNIKPKTFFDHAFQLGYFLPTHSNSLVNQIVVRDKEGGVLFGTADPDEIKSFISEHNLPTRHFRKLWLTPPTIKSERMGEMRATGRMIMPKIKTPSVDI